MPFSPFGATVEVAGAAPFLNRQPIDILLDGNVQDLPWMTTVTTEEGVYPTAGIHQCKIEVITVAKKQLLVFQIMTLFSLVGSKYCSVKYYIPATCCGATL
jgi:hypothetical protein